MRSIGVSNFTEAHLERVIERTGITPSVNQIELHPAFPQAEMRAVNERLGIRTQSWSPLGRAKQDGPVGSEAVVSAAEAHGVPIEKNAVLAEALSTIELETEIPERLYGAVAEILAFVLRAAEAGEQAR